MNLILFTLLTILIAALLYIWIKIMEKYGGSNL